MRRFKSINTKSIEQTVDKKALMFGLTSVLLYGIASNAVSSEEQGRIQGGSQSIQALTRIIGPILGGELYVSLGHFVPAVMGMILVAEAIIAMHKGTHVQF